MRGKRVGIAKSKADLVLVAIRFEPAGGRVSVAQGYERRGVVWSDLKLFSREEILARVRDGHKVFSGKPGYLEGDFELFHRVEMKQEGSADRLLAGGNGSTGDELGLPLF